MNPVALEISKGIVKRLSDKRLLSRQIMVKVVPQLPGDGGPLEPQFQTVELAPILSESLANELTPLIDALEWYINCSPEVFDSGRRAHSAVAGFTTDEPLTDGNT